jgi:hypothetical protein
VKERKRKRDRERKSEEIFHYSNDSDRQLLSPKKYERISYRKSRSNPICSETATHSYDVNAFVRGKHGGGGVWKKQHVRRSNNDILDCQSQSPESIESPFSTTGKSLALPY